MTISAATCVSAAEQLPISSHVGSPSIVKRSISTVFISVAGVPLAAAAAAMVMVDVITASRHRCCHCCIVGIVIVQKAILVVAIL